MKTNRELLYLVCAVGLLTQCCADANSSSSNDTCQTPGFVKCDGICIDPMTSSSYCGANEFCENYVICKDTQTCQVGKCSSTTTPDPSNTCQTPGFVKCNGTCIDPMTSNSYCGANEFCENYEICKDTQTCQEGKCSPTTTPDPSNACQTQGFVKCNGTCIDPMTSNSFCGANEFCENYEICKDAQSCQEGKCQTAPCQANEHKYNEICESDSLTDCGKHGFACASEVDGWKSGTCEEHQCKPFACMDGKHIYQNTCEDDSITNCGNHDVRCSQQIVGWLEGTCVQGTCHVAACENGLHLYGKTCELDDTDNCGEHGMNCETLLDGWKSGHCIQSQCHVTTCQKDMHPEVNSCVYDTVNDCGKKGFVCAERVPGWKSGLCTDGQCKILQCIDGYHVDAIKGECILDTNQCCGVSCIKCTGEKVCGNSQCRDQCPQNTEYCSNACVDTQQHPNHCGECGHDCNAEKPENAKSMTCNQGTCLISVCDDNYHIEIQDKTRVCQPDTVNACGIDAIDCTSQPWWKDGACTDGICVPSACKGDYHLTENEAGEYWCEPDNALNCGEHGHVCGDGQECIGARCLGNTVCDDIMRDTRSDLNHCGECNHRCNDGLSCVSGTCKLGNGQAYCSGSIVAMGTIDHCSSCTDRCGDNLICKNNACVAGAGTTYCSNIKLDSRVNIDNCGACNHRCNEGLICNNGECKPGNGVMYCDGIKIDSTEDSANCSGCGNLYPAGSKCGYTSDIVACYEAVGSTYCSGIQRDISNDSANCGQCGKVCSVWQMCKSGVCTEGVGSTYCNGISRNTSNDSANCGQCGKVCGAGQIICQNGVCTTGTGTTYCNEVLINTSNDSANCGQCGKVCSVGQICQNGVCTTGKVDDIITFGHYEQDNVTTNGKEPIEWRILDIDSDGHLLVISDKVLDNQKYNERNIDITWEKSMIRSWLNGYDSSYNTVGASYTSNNFIDTAFTIEEKARIITSDVLAHPNPHYSSTPAGNPTTDKIFLLSVVEAESYLTTNEARKAYATLYAINNGVYAYNYDTSIKCTTSNYQPNKCSSLWWLRSKCSKESAACVHPIGEVSSSVIYNGEGVRPALWIN